MKAEGYSVRGVDLKFHEYCEKRRGYGRTGTIFTGELDASVMHNSGTSNLDILEYGARAGVAKLVYSSSDNPRCPVESKFIVPLNIGFEVMVTMNQLAAVVMQTAGKSAVARRLL